jgi:hypothetical protein
MSWRVVSHSDAARTEAGAPAARVLRRGVAVVRVGLALSLGLVISGCAVRAPYTAPATAPAALKNTDAEFFRPDPYDPRWWRQFEDPVLEQLEGIALESNHDV